MRPVALRGDLRLDGRCLISGLDVEVAHGAWTALLGPSGLGKTSLARLVAGLPTPASLDGFQPPAPQSVGLMSQDGQLLPWASATENVVICERLAGRRPDLARAGDLLARVGLQGLEDRRPATLSAGQRQRIALARVLYENRDVVLLDEPFSALDVLTRQRMQDLAANLLEGRTVLLITHDPAEAVRLAHQAYVLDIKGSTPLSLPGTPPPRAADAPETLAAQAALLRRLSESADGSAVA